MALLCAAWAPRKDEPLHSLHRPLAAAANRMPPWRGGRSRQSAGHTLQLLSQHMRVQTIVQPSSSNTGGYSGNVELKGCPDSLPTRMTHVILTMLAYRNDIHIKHPLRWWNEAKVDGVSRDPELPASGHCWQKLLLHNGWGAMKHLGTLTQLSMHFMPVRHLSASGCRIGSTPYYAPQDEHIRLFNLPPHPCRCLKALCDGSPRWSTESHLTASQEFSYW